MGAPYYGTFFMVDFQTTAELIEPGAYAAVAFLAGASQITALDKGSNAFGGYATFDSKGDPLRVLLMKTRPVQEAVESGLSFLREVEAAVILRGAFPQWRRLLPRHFARILRPIWLG